MAGQPVVWHARLSNNEWDTLRQRIWGWQAPGPNPPTWQSVKSSLDSLFVLKPRLDEELIEDLDQLYEFIDVLKYELQQDPDELIRWIWARASYDAWALIELRFEFLRNMKAANSNNPAAVWGVLRRRLRIFDQQIVQDQDKVHGFLRSVELALRVWLMMYHGGAGGVLPEGEVPHDWPPPGDMKGTGLLRGLEDLTEILYSIIRQGYRYQFDPVQRFVAQVDAAELEEAERRLIGLNNERPRRGRIEDFDPLSKGWYLESFGQYLHLSCRQILGQSDMATDDRLFAEYFTLDDIRRIGHFRIIFTDSLFQHLRIVRRRDRSFRPTVYFFRHASILEHLSDHGPTEWYRKLARETLLTMALLVPGDPAFGQSVWFKRVIKESSANENDLPVDAAIGEQLRRFQSWQARRVSNFDYWKKRLLILEEEFQSTSTWSITSWWYDRRKGREWVAFWIQLIGFILALVALILAVVSALVAALQAIDANDYARQANGLASLANEYASNASTSDSADVNATTTVFTFTTIQLAGTTTFIGTNINQINNVNSFPTIGGNGGAEIMPATATPSL
ncbi:hypothetical protein B0I35DRAFT_475803 [Stachybotrys elegans]|uniref:Uncharacterized protein n=1 Tax=Stachybotrys elegans TaxID=80388 RepID=A0A8K0SWA5_9HYPO|nr:hypothetical protein B0I35DRAFT_475803 [Stachybotrys elegans]